eukprot:g717.t1
MSTFSSRQVGHMRAALAEAQRALDTGEVPVGCVFVLPGSNKSADSGVSALASAAAGAADDGDGRSSSSSSSSIDTIIATASNTTNATKDATRHAELVAIEEITQTHGLDILKRCELYVTVEPCIMCAAALAQVKIGRVFFGCHNPKFGGCGSILSLHEPGAKLPPPSVPYACHPGLLKDNAVFLLRDFYMRENPSVAGGGGGGGGGIGVASAAASTAAAATGAATAAATVPAAGSGSNARRQKAPQESGEGAKRQKVAAEAPS